MLNGLGEYLISYDENAILGEKVEQGENMAEYRRYRWNCRLYRNMERLFMVDESLTIFYGLVKYREWFPKLFSDASFEKLLELYLA